MRKLLVLITIITLSCSSYLQAQEKGTSDVNCVYDHNDCYCYFDTIYNKCLYPRHYWEMPILADGQTIYDITNKIIIPENFLDENGYYIHITPITILLIIDSDGTVITCEVDKEKNRGITAYERIILKAFLAEKHWQPLICNNKNVAAKYYISLNLTFKPRNSN